MTHVVILISCPETGHGGIRYVCVFQYEPSLNVFIKDEIAKDPETHGSTFCPVILGSDKTTVSVATGQNEYYPLYMSNGLTHNNVRRAHRNAVTLIAFLAIPKSTGSIFFPDLISWLTVYI